MGGAPSAGSGRRCPTGDDLTGDDLTLLTSPPWRTWSRPSVCSRTATQRVDHGAGGVVHRQQPGELGTVITQPPMETAVDLHQHPSLGHPLSPDPALGRTPMAWAGYARFGQNAAHRGPAQTVGWLRSMPSRCRSNSVKWVWLAPAQVALANCTTALAASSATALRGLRPRFP